MEVEVSFFDIWDYILPPIYLLVIFFIADLVKKRNIERNSVYVFYSWGLFAKIIGGVSLSLIYALHYHGGDTTNYFHDSVVMLKLLVKSPEGFSTIMLNNMSIENYSYFDNDTGFLNYFTDSQAFAVVRFTTIITLVSAQSFMVTTIMISALAYIGIWKLYLLFCELFPKLYKQFALAILFFPSLIFWGSGILKDTYTLACVSWFTYSFYYAFIKKEKVGKNMFAILVTALIIISLKPYIFIALMPGTLIWLTVLRIKTIQNWFLRVTLAPMLILLFGAIIYLVFANVKSNLDQYSSVESILNKASTTQKDLKMAYNMGNSFDIGEYDATFTGVMSKAPVAIVAGLFRPFIWEAKNVLMAITGLENLILLGFTVFLLLRVGIFNFFGNISKEPILFFSIIFSLFFAFSVGVSTSNFGSMVRYKIPAIPFFLSALIILNYFYNIEKQKRIEKEEQSRRRV
jgi:hypothetical protein